MTEPPLGLMPRYLYEEHRNDFTDINAKMWFDVLRYVQIHEAITRYIESDKSIPDEWFVEILHIRHNRLYHTIFQS